MGRLRCIYHSIYITSRMSKPVPNAGNFLLREFYGSTDSKPVWDDHKEELGRAEI